MAADLAPDLPPAVAVAMVAAWAQLFGLVGFELFGQFNRVVEDRERFFRHAAGQLAHGVGLVYGQQGPNGNGTAPGSGAAAGAGRAAAHRPLPRRGPPPPAPGSGRQAREPGPTR